MSVQAITWALKQKTGSPSAKAILLALANYAGADGDCYPSQERLADDTEQSVDSVQRRLRELEALGFIFRQHRQGRRGYRRSDEFVILMDDATRARAASLGWAPDVGQEARSTGIEPRHVEANTASCDLGNEAEPTPQTEASNTADSPGPKPHSCGTEPKQEPSQEPPPTPQGGSGEGDAALALWMQFEAAWGFEDPTDRREPARKAFDRLTITEARDAIAAAPLYQDACKARTRKPCHARTWLSDKGWQGFGAAAKATTPEGFVQLPTGALIPANKQWIAAGSAEAAAWNRHSRETKGVPLWMHEQTGPDGKRALGCWKDTQWPPRKADRVPDQSAAHQSMEARP